MPKQVPNLVSVSTAYAPEREPTKAGKQSPSYNGSGLGKPARWLLGKDGQVKRLYMSKAETERIELAYKQFRESILAIGNAMVAAVNKACISIAGFKATVWSCAFMIDLEWMLDSLRGVDR